MVSSIFLYAFCVLTVRLSTSASTNHWTGKVKFEKESESNKIEDAAFWMLDENITEASVSEFHNPQNEPESENNSTIFDDLSSEVDINHTVNPEPIATDKEDKDEEDKYIEHDVFIPDISKMDENILLYRNNCNLEIEVGTTEDVKVRIKLESLKQKSSGKCCITLNGHEGTMLAVVVSDIHLHYHNDSFQGETLKVVVTTAGVDFVIKQYCGKDENLPLLLTETNRVYLILNYNVTIITPDEGYTEFNLEAFTYHKHQNSVTNKGDYEKHYSMSNHDIENVFFTTEETPEV